ncbi:ankyrin [Zopfia rhizophila CBS 207.26]|uniref:Ankyrin n=1 Tax=Zopfia rhizophila CBS 207.26 TaxID=1314779 RepID=A0A6A6DXD6_9PEZI|nr:ankyrin [Zopfia rhizophila CBS 207.26]
MFYYSRSFSLSRDMSGPVTIAARCAALGNAIVKIISSIIEFVRRVRDSRHDMSAMNAELLTIKTILEIIQGDTSKETLYLPFPLLHALIGTLDHCGQVFDDIERTMVKLSSSMTQTKWIAGEYGFGKLRLRLESLRSTLDLALDHISLCTIDTTTSSTPTDTNGNCDINCDTTWILELLKRNEAERKCHTNLEEGQDSMLIRCLNGLRTCAERAYEEAIAGDSSLKRSDSLGPESDTSYPGVQTNGVPSFPEESSSLGINAWLEDVTSHATLKPLDRINSTETSRNQVDHRPESTASISFFSDTSTSGSFPMTATQISIQRVIDRRRTWRRNGKSSKGSHHRQLSSSTSSPCTANQGNEKIRIAAARRKALTNDQKVALDWALKKINTSATPEYVKRLLDEGANPNVEDSDFGTVVMRAAYQMTPAIITVLAEYGAKFTHPGIHPYPSAVHAAVAGNRLENVQCLLNLGADIDAQNADGETSLHLAVKYSDAHPIAKYLLDAGADVNGMAAEAGTPLHVALTADSLDSRGRKKMAALLRGHGADCELNAQPPSRSRKGLSVLGLI